MPIGKHTTDISSLKKLITNGVVLFRARDELYLLSTCCSDHHNSMLHRKCYVGS